MVLADHTSKPGEQVAIKILKKKAKKTVRALDREVRFLEKIAESKLEIFVNLLGQTEYAGRSCLIFEKLDLSLRNYIKGQNYKPMHTQNVRIIAQQLLQGLEQLREWNITHCDIKTDNIMFVDSTSETNPLRVKIIDLGIATNCNDQVASRTWQTIRIR